jgi:septal ring factor EnvC (AmiA/AmiB activator)
MNRCVKIIVAGWLVLFCLPLNAQNTRGDLEKRRKLIQKEINETERLIRETRKNKTVSLSQLNMLSRKLEERKKLILTVQREISLLSTSIKSNDERIRELQANLDILREKYGRMVRLAYMNRKQQSVLLLVFSAKDVHQAARRLQYLKTYNAYLRAQAGLIKGTQEELSGNIARLTNDLNTKTALLGTEEREKQELSEEKKEQEQTVSELKKKEKTLRKDLAKKQADVRKVNAEIQRVIEREIAREREKAIAGAKAERAAARKKAEKAGKPEPVAPEPSAPEIRVTPEAKAISGRFEANRGRLPWPVDKGAITEGFGPHPHPVLKNIVTFNNGIDIATTSNAGVKAIFDGEVSGVISIPGANQALILKHGEYLSVYGNLETVRVKRGDRIKAGQLIGAAADGDTEGRGEAHLEIWKGKIKLNPSEWIAR